MPASALMVAAQVNADAHGLPPHKRSDNMLAFDLAPPLTKLERGPCALNDQHSNGVAQQSLDLAIESIALTANAADEILQALALDSTNVGGRLKAVVARIKRSANDLEWC